MISYVKSVQRLASWQADWDLYEVRKKTCSSCCGRRWQVAVKLPRKMLPTLKSLRLSITHWPPTQAKHKTELKLLEIFTEIKKKS